MDANEDGWTGVFYLNILCFAGSLMSLIMGVVFGGLVAYFEYKRRFWRVFSMHFCSTLTLLNVFLSSFDFISTFLNIHSFNISHLEFASKFRSNAN